MNRCLIVIASILLSATAWAQQVPNHDDVRDSLHRAISFFRQHASAGGGYIYQLSADLKKREGEGKVSSTVAWIEPPATPAVGMAYLEAYRTCGDSVLLEAAKETANALIRGQLRSGGWDNMIEFDPGKRNRYAYRTESDESQTGRNITTFDDDKSQSSIRFLIQLDKELELENEQLHGAVLFALDGVLKAQYPCGAWPQRFNGKLENPDPVSRRATFQVNWSREYPGTRYDRFYTINDNTISDLITTLLDAWDVYQDRRYLQAAQRGGDFLLLAQLPEPQPGWAQQYNREMQPAWARKFEPPAITGGESQDVMRTLIQLYRRTAAIDDNADRFLAPLPRAIAYYRSLLLPDGRMARFYEIGTDRPLYFTKDYKLTYDNSDMPTHYAFIFGSSLDSIERHLKSVQKTPRNQLHQNGRTPPRRSNQLDQQVLQIIRDLDDRGAWVEPGRLKYHGDDDPTPRVIRSVTFSNNLRTLARWLGAQ
jgi:hypothetical protein